MQDKSSWFPVHASMRFWPTLSKATFTRPCRSTQAAPAVLAILAAVLRASSLVSNLAADRRPVDVSKVLAVVVAHHKAGGLFLHGPGRREAASERSAPTRPHERRGGRRVGLINIPSTLTT